VGITPGQDGGRPYPKTPVVSVLGTPSNCDRDGMTDSTLTELHHRSADGIEVSLLWSRVTNALTVAVEDSRSGLSFEVPAPAEKALDVFEHPFAYAA
jgi:hypothetical protein